MNAMIGDAGDLSVTGYNRNNPDYVQFFNMSSIPEPAKIFVFLDEHPDSINDGYFINKADYWEWIDLPASYHNGAAVSPLPMVIPRLIAGASPARNALRNLTERRCP